MPNKDKLIQKLFDNQCSREELEILLEMIKNDPSDQSPEVMEKLFHQIEEVPEYEAQVFASIKRRIDEGIKAKDQSATLPDSNGYRKARILPVKWMYGIAASLLFLLALGWVLNLSNSPSQISMKTAFGEMKVVQLPDGSQVTLNGNSTLSYDEHWEEGATRKVYLEGEAFFEVEKQLATRAKFQVITEGLTVEVLGTTFNVNHRQENTTVFLEEGVVKLKTAENEQEVLTLEPGEVVSYSSRDKAIEAPRKISGSTQTSWKTGMLEFEEASIFEIFSRLAEFNEMEFEIKDEALSKEKLTTSLPAHNIEEAISVIEKTTGITIVNIDGKFVLESKAE